MSNKKCIVPVCKNLNNYKLNKIFLRVPHNDHQREQWAKALNLARIPNDSDYMCCEDHFNLLDDSENWKCYKMMGVGGIKLKENVVPHRFITSPPKEYIASQLTDETKKRKRDNLVAFVKRKRYAEDETIKKDQAELFYTKPNSTLSISELDLKEAKRHLCNERKNNYASLETKNRFYLGLPQQYYVLVKLLANWTKSSHFAILLTLKKVRLNVTFGTLANDFGLSVSNASKLFTANVPKIANVVKNFIFWPSTNQIKRNLPSQFHYRYCDVQSIIDCFEIPIDKPSNSLEQCRTWSEYNKCNTVKILISCTPNGFINYVSGAFCGCITNKHIVVESDYTKHLPYNVHVMADRGFKQIEEVLHTKKCNLIRIPSVSTKQKLNENDVFEAKTLAALRIHIERVLRRMKEFEMLYKHSVINFDLFHQILIISCGLLNLQEPLIK